jgi:hypothetical protein
VAVRWLARRLDRPRIGLDLPRAEGYARRGVLAYKFTASHGSGTFTGFDWPLPSGGEPGAWVRTPDHVSVCVAGVHACRVAHLPFWLAAELWEIELSGEVVESAYKLVAPAGRLTRQIEAWPEAQADFARDCAARTLDLAVSALRDEGMGTLGDAALAATSTAELQAIALAAAEGATALAATLIGYAGDCWWDIDMGYYTMCAYVAATAFANHSTGDVAQDMTSAGWAQERERQARWLADRLGLRDAG